MPARLRLDKGLKMQERSTVVWYEVKEKLGLSLSEYAVVDLIDRLVGSARGPTSPVFSQCETSKATLARYLGMSKSGVFRIVDRLVKKGVLLKGKEDTAHYVSLADRWHDAIEPYREKESG